jgi:phosphoesterase RecJ-like protein
MESESTILTPAEFSGLNHALSLRGGKVIICHVSPDGDAIGSSLSLLRVLRAMGHRDVRVVTPDMPPQSLGFLSGIREITVASQHPETVRRLLSSAGVIFCLDFNEPRRVDRLEEALSGSKALKVMIDHHLNPDPFADIIVSRPEVSSTCLLLYNVLVDLGLAGYIDMTVAESLLTGMMTDTGAFSYNAKDPAIYRVVADLMERGADKDRLYKILFDTNKESTLRLHGYALAEKMTIYPDHKASVIVLDSDELQRFGYQRGDTEGLVNKPLSIPEVAYSVFMRQDEPEFIKVSMRSKGLFPVDKLCKEAFGGGGHLNAAGGEFYGTLDAAIAHLLEKMPEFDCYL